ncbi:MAG: HugZ family protein [Burkholderiales bacterium]
MSHGVQARHLARRFLSGALATQSRKLPGYPYASALPCCTDAQGRFVLLISHLAEHTKNVESDPRASFLVASFGAHLPEQERLSVMGELSVMDDGLVSARYLRYFPEAQKFLDIGGFRFFVLEPRSLRYIAGFGAIHTLSPEDFLAPTHPIAMAEADILEHMNADHAKNLREYCRHFHGEDVDTVQMIGIDCDGFDLQANGSIFRCAFDTEVRDADAARAELVRLARVCRT